MCTQSLQQLRCYARVPAAHGEQVATCECVEDEACGVHYFIVLYSITAFTFRSSFVALTRRCICLARAGAKHLQLRHAQSFPAQSAMRCDAMQSNDDVVER